MRDSHSHDYIDSRRRDGAWIAAQGANEEIETRSRPKSGNGGTLSFVMFIAAVVLFKPFVEYCGELFDYVLELYQSTAAFLGF